MKMNVIQRSLHLSSFRSCSLWKNILSVTLLLVTLFNRYAFKESSFEIIQVNDSSTQFCGFTTKKSRRMTGTWRSKYNDPIQRLALSSHGQLRSEQAKSGHRVPTIFWSFPAQTGPTSFTWIICIVNWVIQMYIVVVVKWVVQQTSALSRTQRRGKKDLLSPEVEKIKHITRVRAANRSWSYIRDVHDDPTAAARELFLSMSKVRQWQLQIFSHNEDLCHIFSSSQWR